MTHTYNILTVVGARPQFIKAAALSKAFAKYPSLKEVIVHSGQHYDENLSANFFSELGIPEPTYNLNIGSKPHNVFIGEFLIAFDAILLDESPDLVIVYGDTNTTSAAAIAAAKRNIPLAHVEAGLREFDKNIPEEINKLLTDAVTDLYFTPTLTGKKNLEKEGRTEHVYVTGDISLDLLFDNPKILNKKEVTTLFGLPESYVLCTCHRDNNTECIHKLSAILEALDALKEHVILPLHPRTRKAIDAYDIAHLLTENITIVDPLPFWQTQALLKHAAYVVTDSGGIIKEAYFHKVPSIIIDVQTEWLEAVNEGWAHVAGPDKQKILNFAANIQHPTIHTMALGDGRSGRRIAEEILAYLGVQGQKHTHTSTSHG